MTGRGGETGRSLPGWRLALRYATAAGVRRQSFGIALVVGSILNLINQGDALFGAAAVIWWKIALTYSVPYAVSTYGVVAFRMGAGRARE